MCSFPGILHFAKRLVGVSAPGSQPGKMEDEAPGRARLRPSRFTAPLDNRLADHRPGGELLAAPARLQDALRRLNAQGEPCLFLRWSAIAFGLSAEGVASNAPPAPGARGAQWPPCELFFFWHLTPDMTIKFECLEC